MKRIRMTGAASMLLLAALLVTTESACGHSGKARFHAVVDTDGAPDDLRTLCMLLGNREIEVLAVTTSEGALTPDAAARRVARLLGEFHHEGIPVGTGRGTQAPAPPWRAHSAAIDWGAPETTVPVGTPARDVLAATLRGEEEPVLVVALGSLTNLRDLLHDDAALAPRIERIVWYDDLQPDSANYAADSLAARYVLASGIPVDVVSADRNRPIVIGPSLLDSLATVPTVYARKIVDTHRQEPLSGLIDRGHLRAWDDLVAVYLFAPQCFATEPYAPGVRRCRPAAPPARLTAEMLALLRGKPDSESRVFYGFPTHDGLYAEDVVPIIDSAIVRHGPSEWRAGVLTNELHGHLGIYATIGVKMGIRAREYFNIGVDDILVTSHAGHKPPVSCMNDGLQVATGATVGHGLIRVAATDRPRPEALFTFKDKTIRLTLKPEYARRIRSDVARGVERYGDQTEAYWQYIRRLALAYWLDFDRHAIFDLRVEEEPAGTDLADRNSRPAWEVSEQTATQCRLPYKKVILL